MSQPDALPRKKCWACEQEKSISEFHRNRSKPHGVENHCKDCRRPYQSALSKQKYNTSEKRREKNLHQHYRMTQEAYTILFNAQDGKCAICARPETTIDPRTKATRALCVDHDHSTGQVRELLCHDCNRACGLLAENPARIRALLAYVEKHTPLEKAENEYACKERKPG